MIDNIRSNLMSWYRKNHRDLPWRKTKDPYLIWVSEVMLQQTQVKTVIPYYKKFIKKFPNIQDLANAGGQDVLKIWEGLGYYARARNFHKAAKIVTKDYAGIVPEAYENFRALPGVGDYIAAAVLSIAFSYPMAVVDGNVKRVLARLFLINHPVNITAHHNTFFNIATQLLDVDHSGIFNQGVMELGAMVCSPKNPNCESCPLGPWCGAYQAKKVTEYPKRVKKKPIPTYHMVAGVVEKNGQYLICQRKSSGLLGGLWEFPGGEIEKKEAAQNACERIIKENISLEVIAKSCIARVEHAYTHFKIVLDVFTCRYVSGRVRLNGPVDFKWITLSQIDKYPFHAANLKFIPILKTRV